MMMRLSFQKIIPNKIDQPAHRLSQDSKWHPNFKGLTDVSHLKGNHYPLHVKTLSISIASD